MTSSDKIKERDRKKRASAAEELRRWATILEDPNTTILDADVRISAGIISGAPPGDVFRQSVFDGRIRYYVDLLIYDRARDDSARAAGWYYTETKDP
jgi:hypothetical protein